MAGMQNLAQKGAIDEATSVNIAEKICIFVFLRIRVRA